MKIFIPILLLLISFICFGIDLKKYSDHLVPANSAFSWNAPYHQKVIKVLGKGFEKSTSFRMIAIPSFQSEYAIAGQISNGKYYLRYIEAKKHLWRYENSDKPPKNYPKNYTDVKVFVSKTEVKKSTHDLLKEIWEKMLLEVRYPEEPNVGLDGATFHFATRVGGRGVLEGQIWSPPSDSKCGKLVKITSLIVKLNFSKGSEAKKIEKGSGMKCAKWLLL